MQGCCNKICPIHYQKVVFLIVFFTFINLISYTAEIIRLSYEDQLNLYWKQITKEAETKYMHLTSDLQFPKDNNKDNFLAKYIKEMWICEL